jgi:hypothetical protein
VVFRKKKRERNIWRVSGSEVEGNVSSFGTLLNLKKKIVLEEQEFLQSKIS